jgi:hypothetical protein
MSYKGLAECKLSRQGLCVTVVDSQVDYHLAYNAAALPASSQHTGT